MSDDEDTPFNPNTMTTKQFGCSKPEVVAPVKVKVVFTESEIKDLHKTFDVFDEDKDGAVSKQDIQRVMQDNKIAITDEDLTAIMEQVDTDKSGMIEFDEFEEMMRNTDNDKSSISSGMFKEAAKKELLKARQKRLSLYSKPAAVVAVVPKVVEDTKPKETAGFLWEGKKNFWRTRENIDVTLYESTTMYIINSYHRDSQQQLNNLVLARSLVDALPVMQPPEVVVSEHGHNAGSTSPKKSNAVRSPEPPSGIKSSTVSPRVVIVVELEPPADGEDATEGTKWDRAEVLGTFLLARLSLGDVDDEGQQAIEFRQLSGDTDMPTLTVDAFNVAEIDGMLPTISRETHDPNLTADFHRKTGVLDAETAAAAADIEKARKIQFAQKMAMDMFTDLYNSTKNKGTKSKLSKFKKFGKKQINALRSEALRARLEKS